MLKSSVLREDFCISTIETIELPEALRDEIESRYREEFSKSDDYNGELFNVVSFDINSQLMEGFFTDYKSWVVQRVRRDAFQGHEIKALAVSAIIQCGDCVILGKRSREVSQDAGLWEFCPSGSIDNQCLDDESGIIDYTSQLKIELEEELAIPAEKISGMELICLIEDDEEGVIDICVRLSIESPIELPVSNSEYREFRKIPLREIDSFHGDNSVLMSPVSSYLIQKSLL